MHRLLSDTNNADFNVFRPSQLPDEVSSPLLKEKRGKFIFQLVEENSAVAGSIELLKRAPSLSISSADDELSNSSVSKLSED